jgi:hypothetical protein
MKPFSVLQSLLGRRKRLRSGLPAGGAGRQPERYEIRVVPIWFGPQFSAFPLITKKRSRDPAAFYDEQE